jgi:hypothetical protein
MNGLASPRNDFNFNLTSYLGFATLEGGKYYNDKFVAYYLTHKLPWYFKSFGQNISSFDFVLRGTIGNMDTLNIMISDIEHLTDCIRKSDWNGTIFFPVILIWDYFTGSVIQHRILSKICDTV